MPYRLLWLGLFLSTFAVPTRAQPAPDLMNATLVGLNDFAVVVDLEGTRALTEADALAAVSDAVLEQLRAAEIRATPLQRGVPEGYAPYLYVHINMMDAGRGLIPFAVDVQLFQPARLQRDQALLTAAATWEAGVVGLVSSDNLGLVPEAVHNLVAAFIDAYQLAQIR